MDIYFLIKHKMGTLFDQPVRNRHQLNYDDICAKISMVKDLSKKYKLTVSEVTEILNRIELQRKNELLASNGDIFDEQMGGFGLLIKEFLDLRNN